MLNLFLLFLENEIQTNKSFQVLQAYLNRFLKTHQEILIQDTKLLTQVENLVQIQKTQWQHLQQLLHNNLCLVQYFSHIQM